MKCIIGGQLMVMQRILGIVLHLTRNRQALRTEATKQVS